MVWRLLCDSWRRSRAEFAVGLVGLAPIWFAAAWAPVAGPVAMAFTLGGAVALGPYLALLRLTAREIQLLPVSRRDLWKARWLAATVAGGGWAMLAAAAGSFGAAAVTGDWRPALSAVSLTALAAGLYTGALMGLLPLAGLQGLPRGPVGQRGLRLAWSIVVMLVFAGGPLWPLIFRDRLPMAWNDVSGVWVALAAGFSLLAGVGWSYSPPLAARAGARTSLRGAPAGQSRVLRLFDDRLSGLGKLLWTDWTRTLGVVTGIVAIVGITAAVLTALFEEPATLVVALRELGLLVFDEQVEDAGMAFLLGYIALGLRDLAMVSPSDPATLLSRARPDLLPALVRHLRVLPLSGAQAAAVLVARRILGWLNVWMVLLVVHLALFGAPSSWRLGWLMLVIGCDAVFHAVRLRWRTRGLVEFLVLTLFVLPLVSLLARHPPRFAILDPGVASALAIAAGLAVLAVGWGWIKILLTQEPLVFRSRT